MAVLGGWAVSYERGTPVATPIERRCAFERLERASNSLGRGSNHYRGASLIRNTPLLGPYEGLYLGSYGGSRGRGFLHERGTPAQGLLEINNTQRSKGPKAGLVRQVLGGEGLSAHSICLVSVSEFGGLAKVLDGQGRRVPAQKALPAQKLRRP